MANGKVWRPSHTAWMVILAGKGWPSWRIARKLGFTRECIQRRRAAYGISARPGRPTKKWS